MSSLEGPATALLIAEGSVAFRRDLPSLFESHRNEWVAYHGGERLGFSSSKVELYHRLLARGLKRDELTIRLIDEDSLHETGVYVSSADVV